LAPLRVTCLGAGTIGASWAALFLSRGAYVALYDPEPERLIQANAIIAAAYDDIRALHPECAECDWSKLHMTNMLSEACQSSDWVQENAPDRLEVKHALLREVEGFVDKETPIASSTTALLASEIQNGMSYPARVIVGHPFNPPHLIPLVEVVAGELTDPALIQRARSFYEALGKEVVVPLKEARGHIANRLNAALFREVVHMVASGIATVEEIDRAMVHGPGLRWAFLGPNLVYHLGGGEGGYAHYLTHLGPSQETRWRELGEAELSESVRKDLVQGLEKALVHLPYDARAYRDAGLISLLKLKASLKTQR